MPRSAGRIRRILTRITGKAKSARRIDGEGLIATVRGSSVKETDKDRYLLVSAEILPYFGAAGADENGYIFVPDGCGALIYYNNGKTETEQYSQPVYGNDAAQMRNENGKFGVSCRNRKRSVKFPYKRQCFGSA